MAAELLIFPVCSVLKSQLWPLLLLSQAMSIPQLPLTEGGRGEGAALITVTHLPTLFIRGLQGGPSSF